MLTITSCHSEWWFRCTLFCVQLFASRVSSCCKHDVGALSWLNAETVKKAPTPLFGRLVRCSAHEPFLGDYSISSQSMPKKSSQRNQVKEIKLKKPSQSMPKKSTQRNQAKVCPRNQVKVCLINWTTVHGQEIKPMYAPKRSVTKQSKFKKSGAEAKPTQMKKTIRYKYWLYEGVSDNHNEAPLGELFKDQKSGMQTIPVLNVLTHVHILVWICLSFPLP